MLFLQDHWSSGNQWGDCTCLIVSQWQHLPCCFYEGNWSYGNQRVDSTCLIVSQWQNQQCCFLQDHWSSGNQWGDCTCLIVSQWQHLPCCFYEGHWSYGNQWVDSTCLIVIQWQNQQYYFYWTTGPLVIIEVIVHIWLFHSDKTNNAVFTGPLVLWYSVSWQYMFDCLTVTKPLMLFLQDHWSYGNQWVDSTCLIVSQ